MLYNIKKSFAIHHIQQGSHTIYFEEYGDPEGIPVLFLHGGPGSGCSSSHKALFNSKKFRVIFLDQRGSGKSTPKGETKDNNSIFLIEDIEQVRKFLGIPNWLIVGGSWGSTLAIAYAEKNNDKVNGLILRSLFLATQEELDWAFFKAPMMFRPNLLFDINMALNCKKIRNPIYLLGKLLDSKDVKDRCIGAELWLEYESNLSTLENKENKIKKILEDKIFTKTRINSLPNTPFMEWHYIKNNFFFEHNQLIKNKFYLKSIPIRLIQSDYDLLCPPYTSYSFVQGLNNTEIHRVEKAGHYLNDPGVQEKMKEVIDEFIA